MTETQDIRWKQRFSNFSKAIRALTEAVNKNELSALEKSGLIQTFEFTFELAWETLKDYLELQKIDAKFPRDVIKEAFKYELINDGDVWMDMLDKRNLLSHTYDEDKAELACSLIKNNYFYPLVQLHTLLKNKP